MSDYHFSVTQIRRSVGQSAVACAAYRAGEKLHSNFYGEDNDFTHKNGVVQTGILLPPHVPREYADREFLWNEVEKAEKHPKAQLAYSFDFSLQNEFSMEENIMIAKEFIEENFISRGMIADYAIHLPDKEGGGVPNPHVHVMCPIRPMNEDGTWGAKQKRVYRLDEDGNKIIGEDGKAEFDAVQTTDWGTPETLEKWRAAWAEINNEHFAAHHFDKHIDNRSYEKQGVEKLPTIHEGPRVREMEKKGIRTEKGDRNRWIRQINSVIRKLGEQIKALGEWILELKEALKKEETPPTVLKQLSAYYEKRNQTAWGNVMKAKNLKEYASLVVYLETNGIVTEEELSDHVSAVRKRAEPANQRLHELMDRFHELEAIEKAGARYAAVLPIYEEWNGKHFKKSREAYAAEHEKELRIYHATKRKIGKYLREDGSFDERKVAKEKEALEVKISKFHQENKPLEEEVGKLNRLRKILREVSESDVQERETKTPEKREKEARKATKNEQSR